MNSHFLGVEHKTMTRSQYRFKEVLQSLAGHYDIGLNKITIIFTKDESATIEVKEIIKEKI